MNDLQKVLKENYGEDWKAIEREIQQEINDCLENSDDIFGTSEDVDSILLGYGLEPDYLTNFI